MSAQQARERKKAYLNDLETRATDLEKKNAELEQRVSTLQNENNMLRQVHVLFFCLHIFCEVIYRMVLEASCLSFLSP